MKGNKVLCIHGTSVQKFQDKQCLGKGQVNKHFMYMNNY